VKFPDCGAISSTPLKVRFVTLTVGNVPAVVLDVGCNTTLPPV